MTRTRMGCLIGFAFVLAIPLALVALEYGRMSNLCQGASSRVENAHEAISAVRNYRGPFAPSDFLSWLGEFELFQGDGFGTNGGWSVEKWTKLMIVRGYTVDFSLNDPEVTIRCDVFECGAVEYGSCLTFGAASLIWTVK
jgi:hypothetical protein